MYDDATFDPELLDDFSVDGLDAMSDFDKQSPQNKKGSGRNRKSGNSSKIKAGVGKSKRNRTALELEDLMNGIEKKTSSSVARSKKAEKLRYVNDSSGGSTSSESNEIELFEKCDNKEEHKKKGRGKGKADKKKDI